MAEILDHPAARQQLARISVEEFHRISELGIYRKRTELIRGIVFEKMSISPLHRKISKRLYDHILSLALPGHTVFLEAPLTLQDSEPQPDLTVAAGQESDFDMRHPSTAELVVEVAVSSEALDRGAAALYAAAGVKEYWIILPARRQVEVHRRPATGEYRERQIFAGEEEIVCAALPAVRIPLPALFA